MVEKRKKEPTTREYTINLHKRLHGINFKKRAPRAVKEVRKFAAIAMGTKDVRLDVRLNKEIWSRGVRSVPNRLRLQISRRCVSYKWSLSYRCRLLNVQAVRRLYHPFLQVMLCSFRLSTLSNINNHLRRWNLLEEQWLFMCIPRSRAFDSAVLSLPSQFWSYATSLASAPGLLVHFECAVQAE